MAKSFEEQLAKVRGKIRRIPFGNYFQRKRTALLYYVNCAERMREAAQLVWNGGKGPLDVFGMLAGLSLELLLKGTLMGLQEDFPNHHKLAALCDRAGISLSTSDRIFLEILTEYVTWAAKYPAALDEVVMARGEEILNKQYRQNRALGTLAGVGIQMRVPELEINRGNYDRLWAMLLDYYFQVQSSVHESVE